VPVLSHTRLPNKVCKLSSFVGGDKYMEHLSAQMSILRGTGLGRKSGKCVAKRCQELCKEWQDDERKKKLITGCQGTPINGVSFACHVNLGDGPELYDLQNGFSCQKIRLKFLILSGYTFINS